MSCSNEAENSTIEKARIMTTDEAKAIQKTHDEWQAAGRRLPYPDGLSQDAYIQRLRDADMALMVEEGPAARPA